MAARKSTKYGPKANEKVGEALHEMKRGELRSGRSGRKVTSRAQAVAIGLSQARKAGAKVPDEPASSTPKRARAAKKTTKASGRKTKRGRAAKKTSTRRATKKKTTRRTTKRTASRRS